MAISKTEKVLLENGVFSLVPKGNSMWPFIKNKKYSVIIKSITEKPSLYDVVTPSSSRDAQSHRPQ